MAYNLSKRFSSPPECCMFLDPGSYQTNKGCSVRTNRIPFLSKTPRNTEPEIRIWTHKIYDVDPPRKVIPNCTSMMSKIPRFPYKALSDDDIERILCQCDIQTTCECTAKETHHEVLCQGKIPRRLFKGHPPRSRSDLGLSVPSKYDQGFEIRNNGTQKRTLLKAKNESPPFYDARVIESTAFYKGCKWSKWKSKRSDKIAVTTPGPADYNLKTELTEAKICQEKFRAHKRRTSKQLRFLEELQRRNVIDNRPGPAAYSPKLQKCSFLNYFGPKAKRFPSSLLNFDPGPADYWLKRDFDPFQNPDKHCLAKLPKSSCFGIKAVRFIPQIEDGPSPASYAPTNNLCQFMHCSQAPFGSSSVRFKEPQSSEREDEDVSVINNEPVNPRTKPFSVCHSPTWAFKSKTIRMKQLDKNLCDPSPADLPMTMYAVGRSGQLQYIAPFFTSEGRMQPWFDWMSVFGQVETPGPCYYNTESPKCYPAVCRGPLCRDTRFQRIFNKNPAPNEYRIGGGIDTVLNTHNITLKKNIEKQHKFYWEPRITPRPLTSEEKESLLFDKSVSILGELADLFSTKK